MLPKMLEQDRRQAGWSVGQAAWRLGVNPREYRELETGMRSPTFETWDPASASSLGGRRRSQRTRPKRSRPIDSEGFHEPDEGRALDRVLHDPVDTLL